MAIDNQVILNNAATTFAQFGIQNVTMSDIAAQCNISKKTLYQQYKSKEELVFNVIENQLTINKKYIDVSKRVLPNAVSEMSNFFKYIFRSLEVMTPVFINGVRKYYPAAYKLLLEFSNNYLLPYLHHNMNRGINEQLYRNDMDQEVACTWYYWQLRNLFQDNSISTTERHELLGNTNQFFANCIVNGDGLQVLQMLPANR